MLTCSPNFEEILRKFPEIMGEIPHTGSKSVGSKGTIQALSHPLPMSKNKTQTKTCLNAGK